MKRFCQLTISLLFIFIINLILLNKLTNKEKIKTNSTFTQAALASESKTITIDFALQTATGSPLVFGGAHAPDLEHQDAWDLLANSGVTMIRRDFWIENELPKNITLSDYKTNKNNVQDPATWNKDYINVTNSIYQNTRKKGIKVMAILSYAPNWLTYTGTNIGVPKDWEVYEDIVKKSYRLHRPYLDMIEIWNEPDIQSFLDTTGSGLSREEAYALIFEHAVNAIKSVDKEANDGKKILIIAPAVSNPQNTELFDYLMSKPNSRHIDGVSVHSYNEIEPSWSKYQSVMKKYGKENLPIYVTEWNKTAEYILDNNYTSGEIAIPYTGKKLVQFLKYGIAGANYFSTTYFDPKNPSKYVNSFGFYRQVNNKSELLPQGKSWQLLSRSLGLGLGKSRIYDVNQPDNLEAVGFTNSKSEPGLAIVNEAATDDRIRISLKNLRLPKYSTLKLYIASSTENPTIPVCTQTTTTDRYNSSFFVDLPKQSIIGITMTSPKFTFNFILRVLGISTGDNCFEGI
ncbi:hypothetical protein A2Z22_05315 [Candidatus Woesebacteria bacterium RBG_16_34_12]|uniref:Asl1-like glycosyl hydrolase catalytic domain-containing protein n=1 Tax=Candidatus Woesebacteria bacterium RBG_16_34_12 TaxID=1802480 RepID=A0A1F7X6P8_9BACT|nr:MAG: hypothetical protein A2Z22_05315 [Candidatus Woesebacteria bacterium RBG_16_34_12]